jgi:hypothetical protein
MSNLCCATDKHNKTVPGRVSCHVVSKIDRFEEATVVCFNTQNQYQSTIKGSKPYSGVMKCRWLLKATLVILDT